MYSRILDRNTKKTGLVCRQSAKKKALYIAGKDFLSCNMIFE